MTKLNNLAASLFPAWVNLDTLPEGLRMVAAYAAKRPALEFRDYCSGWNDTNGRAAYFQEARSITKDLQRVREALRFACAVNVQDSHLIECSRGERLTLENQGDTLTLEYCTGQYWPTEYRPAVARLLERAANAAARAQKVAA